MIEQVDDALARLLAAARWLALPLALLLFLQWPLRELFHAGSRQANDLGQCVFALYVALAITDVTRRGSHLAPRPLAPRWAQRWRTPLRVAGIALGLLPWSLFVLTSSRAQVWQSVLQLESFPDFALLCRVNDWTSLAAGKPMTSACSAEKRDANGSRARNRGVQHLNLHHQHAASTALHRRPSPCSCSR